MDTLVVAHEGVEVTFSSADGVSVAPAMNPHVFIRNMAQWTRDEELFASLLRGLAIIGIEVEQLRVDQKNRPATYTSFSALLADLENEDDSVQSRFADDSFSEYDNEAYSTVEQARVGTAVFQAMYPVYAELYPGVTSNDGFYGYFPIGHTKFIEAVTQKTLRDLVMTGFGYYRKDLVKAIVSRKSDSQLLSAAMLAAPYLPQDWIVSFLKREMGRDFDTSAGVNIENAQRLDIVFEGMSRYDIRRIMWSEDHYLLGDVCAMTEKVDLRALDLPAKATAFVIHDLMVKASEGLLEEGLVFDPPDIVKRLATLEVNGVAGRPLLTMSAYNEAGIYMDNCVGTSNYAVRAKEGRGGVILWDTGNPDTSVIAEVRSQIDGPVSDSWQKRSLWYVSQIMYVHNKTVEDELSMLIKNSLKSMMEEVESHDSTRVG